MIVYKLTDGFAHDLRYEDGSYVPQLVEVKYADGFGELPPIETLHDQATVQAKEDAEQVELKRFAALRALDDQRLAAAALDPNAPQEVKDYEVASRTLSKA